MVIFEKKIKSKYTLKRTKLHRFKKFSRGSMPPNPPSNAHGEQIRKSGKKILAPPPNPGDAPVKCFPYAHIKKKKNEKLNLPCRK